MISFGPDGASGRLVVAAPPLRSPAPIPSLDVIDKDNEVKLIADLPGLAENDIDVQVTDSTLMIGGEKKEEIDEGEQEGGSNRSRNTGSITLCGVSRCR